MYRLKIVRLSTPSYPTAACSNARGPEDLTLFTLNSMSNASELTHSID